MDRVVEGARRLGLELSPQQVECFELYYRELIEWNRKVNLTAVVDYVEVQVKHFLDSLTVAVCLERPPRRLLDVGAGAGFPGVPLKLLYPATTLCLLESRRKKAQFLEHLCAGLGLADVDVVAARAEEAAHDWRYRERFDLVVSRGVAPLGTLAELALPYCLTGGTVVAQKKGQIADEVEAAAGAIDELGGRLREIRPVKLEELEGERYLVVLDKAGATPPRYPRRPGIPRKRPIGGKK